MFLPPWTDLLTTLCNQNWYNLWMIQNYSNEIPNPNQLSTSVVLRLLPIIHDENWVGVQIHKPVQIISTWRLVLDYIILINWFQIRLVYQTRLSSSKNRTLGNETSTQDKQYTLPKLTLAKQLLTQQTALHPGGLRGQRTAILAVAPLNPWQPLLSEPDMNKLVTSLLHITYIICTQLPTIQLQIFVVQKIY